MNYTSSDANVIDAATGRSLHQDSLPIATMVSAADMNAINWSLMEVLAAAGVLGVNFNSANPESYKVFFKALQRLLAADTINPTAFGGLGNGVHDDGVAVNLAIALSAPATKVLLPEGRWLCLTPIVNPYGKEFVGPGVLLEPVTVAAGGYRKINTYSNGMNRIFGMEYRTRLFQQLAVGTPEIKAYIYGDSTAQGQLLNPLGTPQNQGPLVTMSGWLNPAYLLQNMLPKMARYKGLNQPLTVVNRGVSSTRWINANPVPDLGPTTTLQIFCYGINHGADPLATRLQSLATEMDAALSSVRAQAYGKLHAVTLVLVTPNAANNVTVNRDEEWNEQIFPVYLAAARKHQCVLIDRYGAMIDTRNAVGYTLDNPFALGLGQGQGVHGTDARQAWDWGMVMDALFAESEIALYRHNGFQNLSSAHGLALASKLPAAYESGLTIERCAPGDGWPDDGKVTTERTGDGIVCQTVTTYAAGKSTKYYRVADSLGNAWCPWTGLYANLTLLNTWVNYSAGSASAQTKLDSDGKSASVKGLISGGTITVGAVVANIPIGYRPLKSHVFVVAIANSGAFGSAIVRVDPNGDIVAQTTLGTIWTSLDGIVFAV